MKVAHFFLKEAKLLNSTGLYYARGFVKGSLGRNQDFPSLPHSSIFPRGKQIFPVPQPLLPNPNRCHAGDLKTVLKVSV